MKSFIACNRLTHCSFNDIIMLFSLIWCSEALPKSNLKYVILKELCISLETASRHFYINNVYNECNIISSFVLFESCNLGACRWIELSIKDFCLPASLQLCKTKIFPWQIVSNWRTEFLPINHFNLASATIVNNKTRSEALWGRLSNIDMHFKITGYLTGFEALIMLVTKNCFIFMVAGIILFHKGKGFSSKR